MKRTERFRRKGRREGMALAMLLVALVVMSILYGAPRHTGQAAKDAEEAFAEAVLRDLEVFSSALSEAWFTHMRLRAEVLNGSAGAAAKADSIRALWTSASVNSWITGARTTVFASAGAGRSLEVVPSATVSVNSWETLASFGSVPSGISVVLDVTSVRPMDARTMNKRLPETMQSNSVVSVEFNETTRRNLRVMFFMGLGVGTRRPARSI